MTNKEKVCVVTLGCVKNIVDSEKLIANIQHQGYNITENPNIAEILIINTCGFIQSAINENTDYINLASNLKTAGKLKKLYVIGCLSERFKDEFQEKFPQVDNFYGTLYQQQLLNDLTSRKIELIGERYLLTPKHYAYLKIQDGCEHKCAFCSIPSFKGPFKSEPMNSLISEANSLAQNGTSELIIIAQDTTSYGVDFEGNQKLLPELLDKVSQNENLKWIRLMYAYPRNFPLKILDLMSAKQNIAKYIDIPIQHISDSVLKKMGRGITKNQTIKLLETIRSKVDDVAIRTTLIVGFPGETEQSFKELLEFVKDFQFDRLGVFEYSIEPGTPGFKFGDPIPQKVKQERFQEIMLAQQAISKKKNFELVGKEIEVIIDEKRGNKFIGRTEKDAPEIDNTVIIYKKNLEIGKYYKFKISSASEYDLFVK
jgi:ribosomal protein S12 methylthiotransferase